MMPASSPYRPWKVVHVDLREPLSALEIDASQAGAFVVFWADDRPLGHRLVDAAALPLAPAQLATLAAEVVAPAVGDALLEHGFRGPLPVDGPNPARDTPPDLAALRALDRPLDRLRPPSTSPTATTISVVVCTHDRPDDLRQCLDALGRVDRPPDELIVVDNAPSTPATQRLVASCPHVRYVHEPRPGLSHARNTGLRHATSDLVAFTDDDVVVHPAWIDRLIAAFADPQIDAVTGNVLPAELETEAQFLFQYSLKAHGWPHRTLTFDDWFFATMRHLGVPVWQMGAGANMAFRRSVFAQVGGFDVRLGAGASGCSEDSELWYRLLASGHRCRYVPSAVVFHYHRRSLEALDEQLYQYMRGHVAALLVQFQHSRDWGCLRRTFLTLPYYYLSSLAWRLLGRGPTVLRPWTQLRGCVAGLAHFVRHAFHPNPRPRIPDPDPRPTPAPS